ncbi:hypothetical protein GHT06_020556 [Daphnia sinensis]|uniref:HAT C-terminal dimerisation domain-containing protein n=1 Tax=Daphnia sinensis TaxID=1820382 RepID=A0AAD5KHZ3_9CRUS|nr:hypothetical protein GHT06_020556 [Daphnia sinensis]
MVPAPVGASGRRGKNFKAGCQAANLAVGGSAPAPAMPNRMDVIRQRLQNQGLSEMVVNLLLDRTRQSTRATYQSAWNNLLEYLVELHTENCSYSLLNIHRSMLSTTLEQVGSIPVGQLLSMKQLLRGAFNRNPTQAKILQHLGRTLFVIPNDTRWNAWFDAIKHVHNLVSDLVTVKKVKSNLKAVCEFLKIPVLTSEDYLFISEYVSVMTPVSYALDVLQGEQHTQVSSGYLLPTIVVIRRRLAELALKEPPLAICKPLVEALQEGLSKRFDRFFKLEYFQLAAVLHPKFKLNWLDYQDEKDLKLKNQIITRIETKLKAIDAEKSSCLNKSVSPEDERDFFTLLSKGGKQENFSNSVWKMELSRYLESKNTAELSCLNQFPSIKQLFHYYNVGLPASAACERLFSFGGRILTPMRTLLGDINFEMLVFLRSNKKVVDSLAFGH